MKVLWNTFWIICRLQKSRMFLSSNDNKVALKGKGCLMYLFRSTILHNYTWSVVGQYTVRSDILNFHSRQKLTIWVNKYKRNFLQSIIHEIQLGWFFFYYLYKNHSFSFILRMTTCTIILDIVLPKWNAHKYKTERSVYTFYIHIPNKKEL